MIPLEAYCVALRVFVSNICFGKLTKHCLTDQKTISQRKILAMQELNARVLILFSFFNHSLLPKNLHQHVNIENNPGLICNFLKLVLWTFHLEDKYLVKLLAFSVCATLFIQSADQELDMFIDGVCQT